MHLHRYNSDLTDSAKLAIGDTDIMRSISALTAADDGVGTTALSSGTLIATDAARADVTDDAVNIIIIIYHHYFLVYSGIPHYGTISGQHP